MKKESSLVRVESNRQNAKLSTGPKTAEGKAAVKKNAVKHGLLSNEVVIRAGDGKESKKEFDKLFASLVDDLKPEGVLEEVLVEKIAVCYWRLRRALRCEMGEIRKKLDTFRFKKALDSVESVKEIMRRPCYSDAGCEGQLLKSKAGIEELLRVVERLREDIEEYGSFSERSEKQILHVFGREDDSFGQDLIYFNWLGSDEGQVREEGVETPPDPDTCRKAILEKLSWKKAFFSNGLEVIGENEAYQLESAMSRLAIPSVESGERLLRYETAIERQLYRAMDQLERLQRQRRGEQAPPTIRMEMS